MSFASQYQALKESAKTRFPAEMRPVGDDNKKEEQNIDSQNLDVESELLTLTEEAEQHFSPQMMTPKPSFLKPQANLPSKEELAALKQLEQLKQTRQQQMQNTLAWRALPLNKQLSRDMRMLGKDPLLQKALAIELQRRNINLAQLTPQQYIQLAKQVRQQLLLIAVQINSQNAQFSDPSSPLNPNNPANPYNFELQLQNGGLLLSPLFIAYLDTLEENLQQDNRSEKQMQKNENQEFLDNQGSESHERNTGKLTKDEEESVQSLKEVSVKSTHEFHETKEITKLLEHATGQHHSLVEKLEETAIKSMQHRAG